jgi:hypothetical protein
MNLLTERAAHRTSIEAFVSVARALPESVWETAPSTGAWSPAQIAEHLRLVYQVVGSQLAGGPGIRIRTPWLVRLLLRVRILPRVLEHGRIPAGARAPREARPGPGPFPRDPLLDQLLELAAATEDALGRAAVTGGPGITHHVFGHLGPIQSLRFATIHNTHHTRQLERRGAPRTDPGS